MTLAGDPGAIGHLILRVLITISITCLLLHQTAQAEVRHKRVEYRIKSTVMRGMLAWDDAAAGQRPAVLVLHDAMGLSPAPLEYADTPDRMCMEELRCLDLAAAGYIAFAADLFAQPEPITANARSLRTAKVQRLTSAELSSPPIVARAKAGLDCLRGQQQVDPSRICVLGYGYGASMALELAKHCPELRGVAAYYPYFESLQPSLAGRVTCPLQILLGRDDKLVFGKGYRNWESQAIKDGLRLETRLYLGAKHGFCDPHWQLRGGQDEEISYHREASEKSWIDVLSFFAGCQGQPAVN